MYSTTTIVKNSKMTGKLVGTHQLLDRAARKALNSQLPRGKYFPSLKEILQFEGVRGPDGLKRKSPGHDDPSHMFGDNNGEDLVSQIMAHYQNLITALKTKNQIRASFEAAWLAHKITDALTPAHHFPLSRIQEELMTDKEFIKVFGEPVKGIMHGNNLLETARNNWIYWGAGGHMSQHIAYEYGVAMIAAAFPRSMNIKLPKNAFKDIEDPKAELYYSITLHDPAKVYGRFREEGWTTEMAMETKKTLLPEIVRMITLFWALAAREAYQPSAKPTKNKKGTKHENH